MKPILIHCHIFYPELWAELKQCILNIAPYPFDLFVTMVKEHPDIKKDILKSFPKAHFEIVANRGYDIAPFIHILNKVDLDKYSYIVKLHTKRDVGPENLFRKMKGSLWRNNLLAPFKNHEIFEKYIRAFEENPEIGMQANYQVIVCHDIYDKKAKKALKKFLGKYHLPWLKYAFVGGTMFIVRARLFQPFKNLGLRLMDFPPPVVQQGAHLSQLAHVMERLFGYFVYYQNQIVLDSNVSIEDQKKFHSKIYLGHLIRPVIQFFWQKKVTKHGFLMVKILKIPVYRRKV